MLGVCVGCCLISSWNGDAVGAPFERNDGVNEGDWYRMLRMMKLVAAIFILGIVMQWCSF